MIKKIIGRRRVADLPVQAVDKSRTSPRYFQVTEFPRKFTAGKNVIKLRAKGDVLVPDSTIHTEILDAQNNPIYHEILNYVEDDGTRVIVVYIYPDTPPGIATVYLAGRARRIRELRTGKIPFSNNPSDPNFKDNPNIKWLRTIPVQPGIENTSEILFVTASGQDTSYPVVQISEMNIPFLDVQHPSGSEFVTKNGSAGVTFELRASPTTIRQVPDAAALQGQGGAGAQIPFVQSPFGKGVLKFGPFNRIQLNSLTPAIPVAPAAPFISKTANSAQSASQVMQTKAPVELPGLSLPQIHTTGFFFEPDMQGATIRVNPPFSIKTPRGVTQVTSSYETTIVKILSSTVANVTKTLDYTHFEPSLGKKFLINGFEPTTQWTASYRSIPTFVATQNSQSYANIVLSNLMPATGDVAKVRIYQRAVGSTGNFKLVNETDIEQQDFLIDETSITSTTAMGTLINQAVINKYWTRISSEDVALPTAVHDNTHLMSSMKIIPDAGGFSGKFSYHAIKLNNAYQRLIYKGAPYFIEFDAKSFINSATNTSIITSPRIDIYMSGSAFNATAGTGQQSPTFFLNDRSLGKHIGTIEGGSGSRFDNIQAHFEADKTGTGVPIFVVRNGEWLLSEIRLFPNRLEGFSPSVQRIIVPVSIEHLNTAQEFEIKYYDVRGKASKHVSRMSGCVFTGANTYIQGGSNLLTGSVFIGNSVGSGIEMAGVSSGFIRSIGYEGFDHAFNGTGGPGFMIYSGSVLPDSGTDYDGVGIEAIQDSDNFFRYRTNPAELEIRTKKFFLGSTSSFISGAGDGTIALSSSNFELTTTGDVTMQGTITATAGGTIGGFSIGSDNLTATNFVLNTTNKSLTLGSSNNIFVADADDGIHLGNATFASAPFSVDLAGALKATNADITGKISATSGDIGGFSIDASTISSSNNNLILKSDGQITGSDVQFTGGEIGGFTIDGHSLSTTGVEINDITQNIFISSSKFKVDHSGNITASNVDLSGKISATSGDIGGFSIDTTTISSSNNVLILKDSGQITGSEVQFTGGRLAGFEFDDTNLFNANMSDPTNGSGIRIEADATPAIMVQKGSDQNRIKMYFEDNSDFGLQGTVGNNTIFSLGANPISTLPNNQIAGWEFDNEKLQGGSMIIRKDGTIESDGFASNLAGSGFRLTAASGGFLEVENARIRGTLSTAVFEKESVNAVGGQLYVANSTTLTSSADNPAGSYTATDTTMSVVNVSGFSVGEILTLKKINDTGFSTEYVKVESASRDVPGSDQNFAGKIYIERGLGSGIFGPSQSLGDTPGGAQGYTGSQVIVSTGKLGTGYIRLNANPNDPTTPYIDIVERTGSGVYDVDLKARLGDLSGITDSSFSDDVTGFGLYTQNGYFKGKIEIGSRAAQAPNNKLFLHYNFNGSTNNKILSQTPNGFTASFSNTTHLNLTAPGAATINTVTPTGTELQGPFASASNAITSSQPAGQNAFSAGFRMSFASESMDKHTFITRNFPRFTLLKLNNNKLQWRIYSGSITNDSSKRNSFTIETPADFPIKENDLYHIFVTAKENHSSSIDVYNITSGSYETGVSGKITFASSSGDKLFGWPSEFTSSSYVKWEHGAPGWFVDDNKAFHGTWHDIRYYKDTVLSTSQMEAIVTNTEGASGGTIIDGDSIQTGKIKSNNLSTVVGTQLDLDDGVMKIGGTGAFTSNNGILLEGPAAKFAVGNSSGNFIRFNHTTDALEISTPNFSIDSSGNVTMTGDITISNPEDLPLPPEIANLSSSLENSLSLLGSFTSSVSTITGSIGNLNSATGSINSSLTTMGTFTSSVNATTGSLNSATASILGALTSFGESTASINSALTSLGSATASIELSLADLGNATASLNSATASLQDLITLAEENMFRLWVTSSLDQLKQTSDDKGMYYGTSYYNNEPLHLIFDTGPISKTVPIQTGWSTDATPLPPAGNTNFAFISPDATTGSIRLNIRDAEGGIRMSINHPSNSFHRPFTGDGATGVNPTVNRPIFFNPSGSNAFSASVGITNFGDTTMDDHDADPNSGIFEFNDIAIKQGLNTLAVWSSATDGATIKHLALFRQTEPEDAGAIVRNPAPNGEGLYIGNTHLGYYAGGDWKTYMSSSGDFFLTGGSPENYNATNNTASGSLTWDADSSTLKIQGEITVGAGHGGIGPLANGLVLDFGGPSGSLQAGAGNYNFLKQGSQSNADVEGHTGWRAYTGSVSTLYTYNGSTGNVHDAVTKINGVRIGIRNGQLFTGNTTRTLTWGSLEHIIVWKDHLNREDGQTVEWDLDAMHHTVGGYPWMGGFCGLTRPGYEDLTHAEKVDVRPWYGNHKNNTNHGKFRECGFYVNSWHIYYMGSDSDHHNTGIRYGRGASAGNIAYDHNHGLFLSSSIGITSGYEAGRESEGWFGGSGFGYGSYFDKYKLSIQILQGGGQHMKIYRYYRGTRAYQDEDGNPTDYLSASQSLVPVWEKKFGHTNSTWGHQTGSVLQIALGNYYTGNHSINKISVSPSGMVGGTTIGGNSITTGELRSRNFGAQQGSEIDLHDGTITFGGFEDPKFSVTPPGFVTATNFTERFIEVTANNSGSYFQPDGNNTKLVFDGSLGGSVTMNMMLSVKPPGKIKDFILPASLAVESALVNIIVNANDVKYDNGVVAPTYYAMQKDAAPGN